MIHCQEGERLWLWFIPPGAYPEKGIALPESFLYWRHTAPASGDSLLHGIRGGNHLGLVFRQGTLVGQAVHPAQGGTDEEHERFLGLLERQHSLRDSQRIPLPGTPPRPRLGDITPFIHWTTGQGSLLQTVGRAVQIPLIAVLLILAISQILYHQRLQERVARDETRLEELHSQTAELMQKVTRTESQAALWRQFQGQELSAPAFGYMLAAVCSVLDSLDGRLNAVRHSPGVLHIWCILPRDDATGIVDALLQYDFLRSVSIQANREFTDKQNKQDNLRLLEVEVLLEGPPSAEDDGVQIAEGEDG